MIRQIGSHSRSAGSPVAYSVGDLQGQRFDRVDHVVNRTFSGTGRFQHLTRLGEGESLVNETTIM